MSAAQRGSASLRGLSSTLSQLSLRTTPTTTAASAAIAATHSTHSGRRAFSTTPAVCTKTIKLHLIRPNGLMPPYPYGDRLLYKQSNKGLYGNVRPRTGNNVSSDHGVRTPRTWRPNIQRKRLWSDGLGAWIRTRLSLRVLRTIRKEGGLDAYLLSHKTSRIKELGPSGWRLRWLVSQTRAVREKQDAERLALGLDPATDRLSPEGRDELVRLVVKMSFPGKPGARKRSLQQFHKLANAKPQDVTEAELDKAAEKAAEAIMMEEFALGEEAGQVTEAMLDKAEAEIDAQLEAIRAEEEAEKAAKK